MELHIIAILYSHTILVVNSNIVSIIHIRKYIPKYVCDPVERKRKVDWKTVSSSKAVHIGLLHSNK